MIKLVIALFVIALLSSISASSIAQDCSNPKWAAAFCQGTVVPTNTQQAAVTNTQVVQATSTSTQAVGCGQKGNPCATSTLVPSTATPTNIPGAWVEDWSNGLNSWVTGYSGNTPASSCSFTESGLLHSQCGAVSSVKKWDHTKKLRVSAQVVGRPTGGDQEGYFCGLVLMQDPNIYAQTAVGRNIQPVNNLPNWSALVWWADEFAHAYYNGPQVEPDAWQNFSVAWDGVNTWTGTFNGVQQPSIHDTITSDLFVVLQGGPSGPGTCDFGRVVVETVY